jgi:GAF domain-containing protein
MRGWDLRECVDDRGAGGFDEVLRVVLEGAVWSGALSVRSGGGRQTMATTWSPVHSAGAVVGALGLLEQPAGPGARVRLLTNRLWRLSAVTRELLVADSLEAVTKIVTESITEAAGATVGSLSLLVDDDTFALVGLHGGRPDMASRWATYPVAADTPAGEALRTRRPLVLDHGELQQRFPELRGAVAGAHWLVCLPLQAADRPLGVMTLSFPGHGSIDMAEIEFLTLLADTSAQAVDRLQAQADAADREAKLRFVAAASAELASSLDYETTLQRVAQLAVPGFADWCGIALEQDGWLRTVAVAHVDPSKAALALDLNRRYPPDRDAARGAYAVLRTGQTDLLPEVPDELLVAGAQDEEHLRALRSLGFRSALQVPLKVRDRVLGVITWVTGDEGRRFAPDDVAFGEDLARRAAVAIDNAELHTELRTVAVRLQQAILPEQLPSLPGWELAVRYTPAGRTEASGDFYEVMPLADGRIVLFVGDVMGRGVEAAAAMAQVRAAVRALVAVDPHPDAVITALDRLFDQFDLEQLVTLVYAVLDPENDQVQVLNAGHPAPLLLHAAGDAHQLPSGETLLLGAGGARRDVLTASFHPGDTLLAFTDGLIERRGEDIDQGMQRLMHALPVIQDRPLGDGLDDLVDEVRGESRDDDVAVLALRWLHTVPGEELGHRTAPLT